MLQQKQRKKHITYLSSLLQTVTYGEKIKTLARLEYIYIQFKERTTSDS